MKDAIVVLSGGMDSTAALYWTIDNWGGSDNVAAISFDYGQRHKKELQHARRTCMSLGVQHYLVDITTITSLLGGSALTDDIEVPEGHYEEENMKATVVPNRNSIMSNIAIGLVVSQKAEALVLGVHSGDHAIYPDCRPAFIAQLANLAHAANEGFIQEHFSIQAPWLYALKMDIVRAGEELGVSWEQTWTCYKGGEIHCGRCATCVERLEAFDQASVVDPVTYEDRDYWRTVVSN